MEVQTDFKELLELFNAHKVQYLIVWGYALAYYGVPRYTGDIDIFVNPETQNASYILKALDDFGFGSAGLKNQFNCYWKNQKIKYMKRTKNAK